MGGRHFLAKLLATMVVFLLISDTTPAAFELPPHGGEKMLPPSVAIGGRVGWRKTNDGRVRMEKEEGKFHIAGLNFRSLRSRIPSPPAPRGSPHTIYKSPPPRPPTSPIHHHSPPPPSCTPPPFQQ